MEDKPVSVDPKFEDEEDEFCSCCADEEEMEEREETSRNDSKNVDDGGKLDEFSVRMLFKGVSILEPGKDGRGLSGIGVIIDRGENFPAIQVQKKLGFFVDETVADYLALMDGLFEATRNNVKRVFAFTNSPILFDQIINEESLENPFLLALKQRILEHAENLEKFVLKHVPDLDLESPLRLAQVAIGIVRFSVNGDESVEKCSICREEKRKPMMVALKCSHEFCSGCAKSHVDGNIESFPSRVPVPCPFPNCRYYISTPEYKSFLPVSSSALLEAAALSAPAADTFYCPFADCSVLLDPRSDAEFDDGNNCVECPVCRRFICVKCGVPWHCSMSCEEFQERPVAAVVVGGDVAVDCLAESGQWRRCRMCERMLELTHGCYHLTCWCGHEFCYSCGAEYRDSRQTCECAFWDGGGSSGGEGNDEFTPTRNDGFTPTREPTSDPSQQFEEWAWDSFGSLSSMMDAYSDQERSQLALIQRFLAGGFGLSDHHTYNTEPRSPPPRPCTDSSPSYLDATIKDLHQLPWLERFVSVISDNYYDEYTQ